MEEENKYKENTNIGDVKIWIGDDGIVRMNIGLSFLKNQYGKMEGDKGIEDILKVIEEVKKVIKGLSVRPRFLITFSKIDIRIPNLEYRKNMTEIIKQSIKEINPERAALCGGGAIQRISFSFLIKFAKLDNIVKYFRTEEEAISWLKEE